MWQFNYLSDIDVSLLFNTLLSSHFDDNFHSSECQIKTSFPVEPSNNEHRKPGAKFIKNIISFY